MNDQTPHKTTATRPLLADEGLSRKFGDWCRDAALDHQAGGQEIHDFMAHPDSTNRFHRLINETAKEFEATRPLRERRPRFSLTLGQWKSKKDMIKSVEGKGHKISDWAKEVINGKEFVLLGSPEEYDFFETTVKELTGKDQVTTTELYEARDRLGYCDAPDESACAIREAYTDQPMDEWRYVLSVPRADAYGRLFVLDVARLSDGSWVLRSFAYPGAVWDGDARLLVCRKRQQLAP
ncbi:MAG TPA: hypothetical protein VMQ44_01440 [Candidatus Saccharimonadales bacterium]|nr:hypothetical protein [Candidatus Saccharimonadales bacterium]